ncbi:MAG: DUF309 domain-containing protein [Anaeromyxobacter sp.]|nr:DUF309 domain-containing protein [Anaeromyxobacter sp.]MBL0277966.1 DUF309 domain-containing protein [Anaeromyxobacter sp.]
MDLSRGRVDGTVALLERGRELFVSGQYCEAHEIWEAAWRLERGDLRRVLQGLIQAAGAYQKLAARQPAGMCRLLELALDRLEAAPDGLAGLELERFRAGLRGSLVEARRWHQGGPAPAGPAPLGASFSGRLAAFGPSASAAG